MTILRAVAVVVALAVAPSAALAAKTIHLRVPPFTVPPHTDREVCTFVPVPMDTKFNFQKSVVANSGVGKTIVSHHFLAWVYNGTDIDHFPAKGQIVDSKACLDFGPTDTNARTLIAGAQTPRLVTSFDDGLAQELQPTTSAASGKKELGIILNSHWINSGDKQKRVSVKLKLVAAKPHTIRRFVLPIFEVTANAQIRVRPGSHGNEHGYWGPGSADFGGALGGGAVPAANATACVVGVTSHMHKRGRLFTIDLVQGPVNLLGLGDPTEPVLVPGILKTADYTDPPQVSLMQNGSGMPLHPGEYLRYTCEHDNGSDPAVTVKMGCEEQAGVTPGKSIIQLIASGHGIGGVTTGAARRCASDADCAGFGTGKCVPANLVFGFTSDDDMCIMPGGYYDANASGGCDLASFPVVE
jgi:hypothetical protein